MSSEWSPLFHPIARTRLLEPREPNPSPLLPETALTPAWKPRRPEAEEMETLRVRDVRPLVEIGQEEVCLLLLQRPLRLLWRWRSGGCLGPAAAAEMNSRQRVHRLDRPEASPLLDRGSTGGWHLDLSCPCCSSPCRVLFSLGWAKDLHPSARLWACRRCHRVTYRSSNRPGSSKGKRPPSHAYRKHLEAAARVRLEFMGIPREEVEAYPSSIDLKPRRNRIHQERWEALRTLATCHEDLADEAQFGAVLAHAMAMGLPAAKADRFRLRSVYIRQLQEQLKENSWATRQSSWHRQGRPRGGPLRREPVRLETSRDDRGRVQDAPPC